MQEHWQPLARFRQGKRLVRWVRTGLSSRYEPASSPWNNALCAKQLGLCGACGPLHYLRGCMSAAQGKRLYSADGTVYLTPQGDGNLVLCAPAFDGHEAAQNMPWCACV